MSRPTTYADDPRAQRIAAAARRLNELREAWLNPPDLVVRVPEVVPGYPGPHPAEGRGVREGAEEADADQALQPAAGLARQHPQGARCAVAAAYGWPADLSDDEILARLFELNQARAGRAAAAAA